MRRIGESAETLRGCAGCRQEEEKKELNVRDTKRTHIRRVVPSLSFVSTQELRRDAFALAGERYAELEPSLARLNALETEQKESEARNAEKRRDKKPSGARGSRR